MSRRKYFSFCPQANLDSKYAYSTQNLIRIPFIHINLVRVNLVFELKSTKSSHFFLIRVFQSSVYSITSCGALLSPHFFLIRVFELLNNYNLRSSTWLTKVHTSFLYGSLRYSIIICVALFSSQRFTLLFYTGL